MIRKLGALALALATLLPVSTRAQTPGGLPPAPPGGEEEPKSEGVAEKAPKEPGQLPTVPVLPPWPNQKRKKYELLELDGYFRVRADWLKNFHLDFHDLGSGTPFPEPLSCLEASTEKGSCSGSVNSANMRLRLEPVVNLSESVSVHAQIDALDNVVLGSTPDGTFHDGTAAPPSIPTGAFSGGQVPPEAGRNSPTDSVLIKRAWAEVELANVAHISFGRMPSHWGLGIWQNSGGHDPVHGTSCFDCDGGDTQDRVYVSRTIPGTALTAALGKNWGSSGVTSTQSDVGRDRYDDQPWELDDADDVADWIFALGRLDGPEQWKERIDQGGLVLNYGAYVVRRKQDLDSGGALLGMAPDAALRKRNAKFWIPDLFVRLGQGKLNLEAEATLHYGTIEDLNDDPGDNEPTLHDQTVLGLGGVARMSYLMAGDELELGLEVGYASGDQWEGGKQGLTNYRQKSFLPETSRMEDPSGDDDTISNFFFDPNYHVDLILFRELLGTVTNATYFKPTLRYNLTDRVIFKAATVVSFANVRVSTPGNGMMYGVELDGDLGYHNDDEGFFAGISYGVLFPLSALDHPDQLYANEQERGDAGTAQTIQMRLLVTF